VVVGCLLITLLRHADRVKIACLAQLVNAIAPIMTAPAGPAWRQTIFFPFLHASRYGRGTVLDVRIESPRYESRSYGPVPYLEATAVDDGKGGLTIFAVNRSLLENISLEVRAGGYAPLVPLEHLELRNADRKAANTREAPSSVWPHPAERRPEVEGDAVRVLLSPLSWNVIRLGGA